MATLVFNNLSPFTKLHGRNLDYEFLKTFGCSCFPFLRLYSKYKLNFHTKRCLMIGYIPIHKGYKCLDSIRKIFIARYVKFHNSEFPYLELFPCINLIKIHFQLIKITQQFFFVPSTIVILDSNCKSPSETSLPQDTGPNFGNHHISSMYNSFNFSSSHNFSTQPSHHHQLPNFLSQTSQNQPSTNQITSPQMQLVITQILLILTQ